MKKIKSLILLVFLISTSITGQTITEPVDNPYFILNRKSSYVPLPKELGGKSVKGFAGLTITLDSRGKFIKADLKKLKLSGKINISYQSGYNKKNKTITKYETYLKECASKIKITKTDKRQPPEVNYITFIVRF